MKAVVLKLLLLPFAQKNITVENDMRVNKDSLTDLYVQHAIPLPQMDLPKSRWGKMMEKKREQHEIKKETKRYFFCGSGYCFICLNNLAFLFPQVNLGKKILAQLLFIEYRHCAVV